MEPAPFLLAMVLGLTLFLVKTGFGRRYSVWTAVLCLALAGSFSLWWRASSQAALLSREAVADVPTAGRPGGYVSSDTCRACHPDQYASWRRTYHRTMTQAATPASVQALFAGQTLATPQENFAIQQADGAYWTRITQRVPGGKSERPGEDSMVRRIDMITGSHHMQAFWVDAGSGNLQLGFPFTWLVEDHRWVPRGDTFLRPPDSPPPMDLWNMSCLRCHTTAGQPRPDKVKRIYETRVAELGIACEACHGPAAEHVAANRGVLRRFRSHLAGKGDSTIVQPARLDHVRSSQVCGNCHSMKWFDANDHWAQNGFDYLPGQDLEARTPIIRPAREPEVPSLRAALRKHPEMISEYFWPDGMVRVSGREFNGLIESPCYQKGGMGCLSCHSMHQSNPVNQLAAGKEGNEACLVCHAALRGKIPTHTHHPADSPGSLCYNCHMPYTTYGLLKAIRSHQIDSPSVQSSLDTGRPNACNLCHLDKTLTWTGDTLKKWYGHPLSALGAREQSVSAALLWAMKGDAGQRTLIAWSLGWQPAREASGESWIAPYLGRLLDDPYAAVRYVAGRSLKSLPGFAGFEYDYVGPPNLRAEASRRAIAQWGRTAASHPAAGKPATLMNPDGSWREQAVAELQALRDDRPVHLRE